jgi:hypothetical protein
MGSYRSRWIREVRVTTEQGSSHPCSPGAQCTGSVRTEAGDSSAGETPGLSQALLTVMVNGTLWRKYLGKTTNGLNMDITNTGRVCAKSHQFELKQSQDKRVKKHNAFNCNLASAFGSSAVPIANPSPVSSAADRKR